MTLTDLIKSAEEKLANPDLTLGTRRREEAILHHLTSLDRTVTELVSENTEMYVALCENVAQAEAVINEQRAKIEKLEATNSDTLIRHKWPEEKPEDDKQYLVRLKFEDGDTVNGTLCYDTKAGRWCGVSSLVTHWWNLPEVREWV